MNYEERFRKCAARCAELAQENNELMQKKKELNAECDKLTSELVVLDTKIESLKKEKKQ